MLVVNNYVKSMLKFISRIEMVLKGKLEIFVDCLCDKCTIHISN